MNQTQINSLVAFMRTGEKKDCKETNLTVALAYAIPVTGVPVEEIGRYFSSVYPRVCEIVSALNEEHLVKVREITEGVRTIFLYRVEAYVIPQVVVPSAITELDAADQQEIMTLVRTLKELF